MSGFTDEAAKQKLAALNETQEGIVGVAQWFLFHRRHAERMVHIWRDLLNSSNSSKRLNLLYLANELVQQSKNKRREEFLNAFSTVIANATAVAYKSASNEVQNKLRRVVEVWRQRAIFDTTTQDGIEARVNELEKDKSSSRRPLISGSLFSSSSSSTPSELTPLVTPQTTLSKAELNIKPALSTANTEYDALTDPSKPTPSPPVHAAKLSQLLKSLANAEGAVTETLKARHSLIEALEKLLTTNREKAEGEQRQLAELHTRKAKVEDKKKEVEDAIMNGLSAEDENAPSALDPDRWQRPEIEELTPPPTESFTPPGEPLTAPREDATATATTTTTTNITSVTDSLPHDPSTTNESTSSATHNHRPSSPQISELPEYTNSFSDISTFYSTTHNSSGSASTNPPPPGLTEALSVLASSKPVLQHRPDSSGSNGTPFDPHQSPDISQSPQTSSLSNQQQQGHQQQQQQQGVKRRRTDDDEFAGFGNDGLDEETVGMLS